MKKPEPWSRIPKSRERPRFSWWTLREPLARLLTRAMVLGMVALGSSCKSPVHFDAKSVAFKPYDERLKRAVRTRWYDQLDRLDAIEKYLLETGKVVLRFNLHDDGHVTDITIIKNTTNSDLLASFCQNAVRNTRFEAWSPEMRNTTGKPYREVTITFDYY